MTDIYVCKFFNEIVKGEIKNNFMKRVVVNGMTGSSRRFKRFERVSIIVTNINKKPISLAKKNGMYRLRSRRNFK